MFAPIAFIRGGGERGASAPPCYEAGITEAMCALQHVLHHSLLVVLPDDAAAPAAALFIAIASPRHERA